MIEYSVLTPKFDLPADLHQQLVQEIHTNQCIPAPFYIDGNKSLPTDPLWFRLYQQYNFNHGSFQTYRLSDHTNRLVQEYYKDFIDYVGFPYKIRYKSMKGIRRLFPHSDRDNSNRGIDKPHGDAVSIYVGIITNNELTNWHYFDGKFQMNKLMHLLKLKKVKSLELLPGQACLFDNDAIHSVTNCNPKLERWGLAISWQDTTFEEVAKKYLEYSHKKI